MEKGEGLAYVQTVLVWDGKTHEHKHDNNRIIVKTKTQGHVAE